MEEASKKKLFKMNPPAKYSSEKDADSTYAAVHKFLSQLSLACPEAVVFRD